MPLKQANYSNNQHQLHNIKWQLSLLVLLGGFSPHTFGEDRRVTTNDGNVNSPKAEVKVPANLQVPAEWRTLIDPTTEEFWSEGNFKPDAGFVLWAKNPTIENAKLYLIRMNAKRDRLHVMQKQQEQANKELIKLGAITNDYDFLAEATRSDPKVALSSINETQIFFLFNPTCPHCKRQAQILSGQQNVTPMQIGGTELLHFPNLPQSVWATKEDIDRYAADKEVPVLLVYDRKTNNMASVKGVHTLPEIDKIAKHLKTEVAKHE